MRASFSGILLYGCLLACGLLEAASPFGGLAPANAPAFQYLGAWQEESGHRVTIYPGSQIRFKLKGQACLELQPGHSGSIFVAVRKDGNTVWTGLLGQMGFELDGGAAGAMFSVVYLASCRKGFDPAMPEAQMAELRFDGAQLGEDGVLETPLGIESKFLVDFIGDSITAGGAILGRSENWNRDDDASLTYAFQLAEKLGVRYRIRGYSGEDLYDIVPKIPYVRKGIPFQSDESPDLVFVNMGANDRHKDDAHYRAGMRNLLNAIFVCHPKTRVVLLNFHRMTPNRWPLLTEMAKTFPLGAVVCFDARSYLVGYSDQGVHPDVESHRLLADALYGYLQQTHWLESPSTEGVKARQQASGSP
jgi:lysophospholipase L1-like esterase